MSRALRRALWALALIAFAGGILAIALLASAKPPHIHSEDRWVAITFGAVIGWSFTFTGLYLWSRRPDNATGALMTGVGFTWLLSAAFASDQPAVFIFGWAVSLLPYGLFYHLLLAYPTGRLETTAERTLVGLAYFVTVGGQLTLVPFADSADRADCPGCPENPLLISDQPGLVDTVEQLVSTFSIVAIVGVVVILTRRWRTATAAQRTVLTPVYVAAGATSLMLISTLVADLTGLDEGAESVVDIVGNITLAAVPLGFLVGLLRSRFSQATAVGSLVERLGERRRDLREAVAQALGDPSVALAYRVDGGWVDQAGRSIDLPDGGWTPVEHDGRVVGAIVHDERDSDGVRAVAAAAGLAMENERLQAELRANIEELRESRARIVEAGDQQRRRIERDLHDGAQQRLVALALTMRLARTRVDTDPAEAGVLLDEAAVELQQATAELRELARGIHPAVLADRGLAPAVTALAGRSPVPVEVEEVPKERLPEGIEAAAYFVVAEALTNVARYARASHASVRVARDNGCLLIEVRDDGVGGADPAGGSGLRGLADRLAALDGSIRVESAPGAGTLVHAELPCGS